MGITLHSHALDVSDSILLVSLFMRDFDALLWDDKTIVAHKYRTRIQFNEDRGHKVIECLLYERATNEILDRVSFSLHPREGKVRSTQVSDNRRVDIDIVDHSVAFVVYNSFKSAIRLHEEKQTTDSEE